MFFQMNAALAEMQRALSEGANQQNSHEEFAFFGPYQDLVGRID